MLIHSLFIARCIDYKFEAVNSFAMIMSYNSNMFFTNDNNKID